MGFYGLLIISIGILTIAGFYSRVKNKNLKNNIVYLLILSSYITVFFVIHHDIEKTCEILISDNLAEVLNIIRSWGIAAPIISILLMILQAIIAPIPAYLITAANGIIFGLFWGVIISVIGALLGAILSFAITRYFYNNYSSQLLKNSATRDYIEKISSKHGFKVILVARLIPIISFDLISYAAGASTIKTSHFLVATFIGMLPATIIYTAIADSFGGIEKLSGEFVIYSSLAALILAIFWILKNSFSKSTSS